MPEPFWSLLVPRRSLPLWVKIGGVAALISASIIIRLPFEYWVHGLYPFATFFPAVQLSSLAFGLSSALVSLFVGGVSILRLPESGARSSFRLSTESPRRPGASRKKDNPRLRPDSSAFSS
jgi:hypothetical protein